MSTEQSIYQIKIQGHLNDKWSGWFDGVSITKESDGTTLLTSSILDQSALYGLLKKIRDLGMPLISVHPVKNRSEKSM